MLLFFKEKKQMNELDKFVDFLIKEMCEGCEECEPKLSSEFKPNFACCTEGQVKWLLDMKKRFQAENTAMKEQLKKQRSRGLGCVAVYACKNTTCSHYYQGTCIAPKNDCINCNKRIKKSKKRGTKI